MIGRVDVAATADVGEHGVERREVRVDVGDQRVAHRHQAQLSDRLHITVADAGHADLNSTVSATSSGTAPRSMRSNPKLGK